MIRNQFLLLLLVVFFGCQEPASQIERPTLPPSDIDNGGLFLPDGFGALVVVDSVGPSRHLAVRDNGDIYIKLSIVEGKEGNVALRDTTNNGKADVVKRFGDYLNDGRFATEMRIHNGYLYFSSELTVYRQKLQPDQLIPEGNPEIIMIDEFPIRWHNAKSLAFDHKGGMYVTFSAPTNACEDADETSNDPNAIVRGEMPCSQLDILGGIWRFDENKLYQTQREGLRYATGIRSVVGMSWNDEADALYAVNHGRDYLHNHAPNFFSEWDNAVLPGEEFMRIQQGDDFGWPYTYYDPFQNKRLWAPEYGGDGRKEAKGYTNPLMSFPAHWAPNDLLFYTGDQFPERYKNGAFVAFHGSTNRNPYPQSGYIVAFVPFKNGSPSGSWEVFADGFIGTTPLAQMQDAKYRPMGLAQGPDGSLYVSDSKQGKVWRILYQEDPQKFSSKALQNMEKRKAEQPHIRIPDPKNDLLTASQ